MDLSSGDLYWQRKSGVPATYPPLDTDRRCDIAVLGAGITGALAAEALSADGHEVIVLDAREAGTGSTSASTSLLQYELDTHLVDLIARHGQDQARLAYRAAYEAIDLLEERITGLGLEDCHFSRKDSVYLASRRQDVPILQAEAEARRQAGIEVAVWSQADVIGHLGFKRPAALHSAQAAQVDAYRLTHGLLQVALRRGSLIFDRTRVTAVDTNARGVVLRTDRDARVRAKRLVVATGYETGQLFDTARLANLRSSFALASEPLAAVPGWWRRCLIWETARPYFYLRGSSDGRAIMGGEDLPFRNPLARDRLIGRKTRRLEKLFGEMFPTVRLETAYAWAGTFGEIKDGLPCIGAYRRHPLCYFALGLGGNGIVHGLLAADIIRAELKGRRHPYARTFRFDR